MIYDNNKELSQGNQSEPGVLPCAQAEESGTEQRSVVSIQGWKERPAHEGPTVPPETRPTKENLHLLSRPQKQAALLKLILSDTTLEDDLDAMIQAAVSVVTGRGGSG
jgi:hypothetical protein